MNTMKEIAMKSSLGLKNTTELVSFFFSNELQDIVEIRRNTERISKERQLFFIHKSSDLILKRRHRVTLIANVENSSTGLIFASSKKIQAEALGIKEEIVETIIERSSILIHNFLKHYK